MFPSVPSSSARNQSCRRYQCRDRIGCACGQMIIPPSTSFFLFFCFSLCFFFCFPRESRVCTDVGGSQEPTGAQELHGVSRQCSCTNTTPLRVRQRTAERTRRDIGDSLRITEETFWISMCGPHFLSCVPISSPVFAFPLLCSPFPSSGRHHRRQQQVIATNARPTLSSFQTRMRILV